MAQMRGALLECQCLKPALPGCKSSLTSMIIRFPGLCLCAEGEISNLHLLLTAGLKLQVPGGTFWLVCCVLQSPKQGADLLGRLLCRVSLQTALCWLCSCSSAARAPTAPQAPPHALAQRDQTRDDFLLAQGILEWAGRDLKPHPAMAGTARSVPGCPAPVSIPGTLQGSELLWRNLCSPGRSRTPQSCIPWTWGGSGVLSSSTCPSWALLVVGWSFLPAATRGLSTCERNSMALWNPGGCSRYHM